MQHLVSILIVAYNAEKLIDKTIRSCLEQSYDPIELLVLDNKSSDKTREIITSFNDPRIRLYSSDETLNPYEGLNNLIKRASGQYIAIQDHDDIWFRDKIEKQVRFLHEHQDVVACGTNTYFYYENKDIFILIKNPLIATMVNHTSLVFRNRGFCYNTDFLLADEHFMKRVLQCHGRIACLQEPLCVHRIRADAKNLSSYRFSLTTKNIKDFFIINGVTLQSALYFCYLSTHNLFPESLTWYIRKHVTMRHREWISLNTFKDRYPGILL